MRSEVTIDEDGFRSLHPPGYLYETELIYKINKKHESSIYNSDSDYHEKAEKNVFPLNKLHKYRLIDVTEIKNSFSHQETQATQILSLKNKVESEKSINRNPPFKSKNLGPSTGKSVSLNLNAAVRCLSNASLHNSTQHLSSIEKNKKELVTILEKSNFLIEAAKPTKLNYFYKNEQSNGTNMKVQEHHKKFSSGDLKIDSYNSSRSINDNSTIKIKSTKTRQINNIHTMMNDLQFVMAPKVNKYIETKSSTNSQRLFTVNSLPSKY